MVRYQGVKDVTPGFASALGGAGNAVKGALGAQAEIQRQDVEQRRLELAQKAEERGQNYISLAQRQMNLAFEKFDFEKTQAEKENILRDKRRSALRSAFGLTAGDETADMPPEYQQSMQDAIESGDADTVKTMGELWSKSRIEKRSRMFLDELSGDVSHGFWTTLGTTGAEVDYTGDGEPDPVEGIPAYFHERLASGKEDPFVLAAEYQALRRQVEQEFQHRQALGETAQKWRGKYAAQEAETNDPARLSAARTILGEYARGQYDRDFGDTELAAHEAEQDYAMALLGKQKIIDPKTNVRSYVDPRDAEIIAREKRYSDFIMGAAESGMKFAGERPKRSDFDDGEEYADALDVWLQRVETATDEIMRRAPMSIRGDQGRNVFSGVQPEPTSSFLQVKDPNVTPEERKALNAMGYSDELIDRKLGRERKLEGKPKQEPALWGVR